MKIYFAGNTEPVREREQIGKIIDARLLSFYYLIRQELGADKVFQMIAELKDESKNRGNF